MGTETERKFVIPHEGWRDHVSSGVRVEQAYLLPTQLTTLRGQGDSQQGELTLSSADGEGSFTIFVPDEDVVAIRKLAECSVRVRIKYGKQKKAFLTIKSANPGTTRAEFEYEIQVKAVQRIFDENWYQGSIIDKVRYAIPYGDLTIELDQFFGDNEGLVMAEVELPDENTVFTLPGWFGPEVTNSPKHYNEALSRTPYKDWPETS